MIKIEKIDKLVEEYDPKSITIVRRDNRSIQLELFRNKPYFSKMKSVSIKELIKKPNLKHDMIILPGSFTDQNSKVTEAMIYRIAQTAQMLVLGVDYKHTRNLRNAKELIKKFQVQWTFLEFINGAKESFLVAKKREPIPMVLPEDDDHFPTEHDRYQYHTYVKALKYISNKQTAVDIGGHVGFYSRAMSENFEQVVAFEPSPLAYACHRKNCPDVICHNVALGDKVGEVFLDIQHGNSGNTFAVEGSGTPLRRLDDYNLEDVSLVKIDVQGFEGPVIHGAIETIKRCRPIMIVELELEGRINEEVKRFIIEEFDYCILEDAGKDSIMGPRNER